MTTERSTHTTKRPILKYAEGVLIEVEDEVASEYALTLTVNGEEFATLVCTPSDLEELVVGVLASEGVIRGTDEIDSLSIQERTGFVYVRLNRKDANLGRLHSKRFIGSCCGKSRQFYLQSDAKTAKTVMTRHTVTVDQCLSLMRALQDASSAFQRTGGVHNAALCSPDRILAVRSDIGRHNAVDKLFGYHLMHKVPLRDKLLAFSGRVSSEMLLKAAKIGVGIVLSKSAPTDLALNLAEELGITVVGFIRDNRCNIYTHPERIVL